MKEKRLGLFLLITLGIGSMIGGGIFNSPTDLIGNANPMASVFAWLVGGFGVFTLVLVFQDLAFQRPELKGGIYSYAREGFGEFIGFFSAFGYWIGGLLGIVAFFPLFFKTLNSLLPKGHGITPMWAFICGSVALWIITGVIAMGVRDAGIVNALVTMAKLIPLALVVILGISVFRSELFFVPDWQTTLVSTGNPTSIFKQIQGAMGTILWCFLGVEAAVVLSGRAVSQKVVSQATIWAFFITLLIYMAVSTIAMGVVDTKLLAEAATPLSDVLGKTFIGAAGATLVKIGLLISVSGATLSWILLVVELPWLAAKDGVMPSWFAKENDKGVPIRSLIVTNILIQIFLLSLLSEQFQSTYNTIYCMSTSTMLIPYIFSGLFACKLALQENRKGLNLVTGILATLYSVFVLYAVGWLYLALTVTFFAIGLIPFHMAKIENKSSYKPLEWVGVVLFIIGAAYLLGQITTGAINLG
ncbi:amino acid permease [Marinisporobacter balticus]|uniref:Arginine:ornithine antiporter (APA family) n=1 Tax=Marinisporobacter balticus TaxID=2018667 RepID=A0A4R2KDJ1_9FIRM|nr:amino acid permease [Marinisporobacter balticus]TCO70392.1 arginine:ornithine antiporter (APA family) [Marinisporobacter balticus]